MLHKLLVPKGPASHSTHYTRYGNPYTNITEDRKRASIHDTGSLETYLQKKMGSLKSNYG